MYQDGRSGGYLAVVDDRVFAPGARRMMAAGLDALSDRRPYAQAWGDSHSVVGV